MKDTLSAKTASAESVSMKIIARVHSDFTEKFGIPRQSGLARSLESAVVFEPEYRNPDALRGLEGFSHIWLLWQFSECVRPGWSPTVRPPRLGGNERRGVFATRSPFRPNEIGLSAVRLLRMEKRPRLGTVLIVGGADLLDGTPVLDIKPYLPFADSHPEATGGFADQCPDRRLAVEFPERFLQKVPPEKRGALREVLENDPRPSYQQDTGRIYGMKFGGCDIRFRVQDGTLRVCGVERVELSPERRNGHYGISDIEP